MRSMWRERKNSLKFSDNFTLFFYKNGVRLWESNAVLYDVVFYRRIFLPLRMIILPFDGLSVRRPERSYVTPLALSMVMSSIPEERAVTAPKSLHCAAVRYDSTELSGT